MLTCRRFLFFFEQVHKESPSSDSCNDCTAAVRCEDDDVVRLAFFFPVAGDWPIRLTLSPCCNRMDIFSSITQLRIPYLNGLYNHLLENSTGSNDLFGTTNGCCDAVMCSLAAIVTLETDMSRSSPLLDLMDEHSRQMELTMYIHRASAIRERLLTIDSAPRISEVTSPYLVDDQFAPSTGVSDTASSFETSNIFRHAALLYLSTIIGGPSPDIAETREQVLATHAALLALPPSSVDRSLVFPLCLAGCMTDDPLLRKYFSGRLRAMDGPVGNSGKTLVLMEEVWRRRDNLQIGVSWRDVMRETKLELLLV